MGPVETSAGLVSIDGCPSEEEVAAIVAAIELVWPKPVIASKPAPQQSTTWRYSGRWWSEGRLPRRWG